jgi:hypothetical protein
LVDAVIHANRSGVEGAVVFPERVAANEMFWRGPVTPEFYVDFETVSDLDEDFSRFPEAGGQPLIFMIGCAHVSGLADNARWNHRVFTVRTLTAEEELRVIEDWLALMQRTCQELGKSLDDARVFHWSPAETSNLTDAYNAAHVRHGSPAWPTLPWFDLLNRVVKEQPVTVRGAFGFGLKAIAKALRTHGLIETVWGDGPADGLGAMVGAWWCHREASAEPFTKDKFEHATVDILNRTGQKAELARCGNPGHDLTVDRERWSLNTQADRAIKKYTLHISKFMELGKGRWETERDLVGLREQFLRHMDSYDRILSLRCFRTAMQDGTTQYEYELVEIPKALMLQAKTGKLRLMHDSPQTPKPGYCDVVSDKALLLFRLYFDGGTERKLQIRDLGKAFCVVHATWRITV